ncbi:MAG: hypothetical protein CMH54_14105 [Myxococcales bacterium]|nr:hypothetical protein [Myxococcales bacterium]
MRFLIIVWMIVSCSLPASDPAVDAIDTELSPFSRPSGLWVDSDYLYVTNPDFLATSAGVVFGEGYIEVLDRDGLESVARWALPLPNPTRVMTVGDDVWVLCSGSLEQSEEGLFQTAQPGGLVRISGGLDAASEAVISSFVLEPDGAPGSWVYTADSQRFVLGSSIDSELYVFDLVTETYVHDGDNPIPLTSVESNETLGLGLHPDGSVAVLSFARNSALLFDPQTLTVIPETETTVAGTNELEGPLDVVFLPDTEPATALILLTLSNHLARWQPSNPSAVESRWQAVGLSPNVVRVHGDTIYVVESGANTVGVYDVDGGEVARVVLPVGSNPYDMVVAPGGEVAYVSALVSNRIHMVDLNSFEIVETVP